LISGLTEEPKEEKHDNRPVFIEFVVFPENRWGFVLASEYNIKKMDLDLFKKLMKERSSVRPIPTELDAV
jgi:hypothetical protein